MGDEEERWRERERVRDDQEKKVCANNCHSGNDKCISRIVINDYSTNNAIERIISKLKSKS